MLFQAGDESLTLGKPREEQVVHVIALSAVRGNERLPNAIANSPVTQCGVILLPDLPAARLNDLPLLELSA